ncbi:MAG: glycogen/starch synthase [Thermodesulfobacteriota bacterium]|nr:glycogen/starch synthase [Thermodesulfobacteriota bacterium]
MNTISLTNLSRSTISEEHLISDGLVASEITEAFEEDRAYSVFPDIDIISKIKSGVNISDFNDSFIAIKNTVFEKTAAGNSDLLLRFQKDARLSSRIINAIKFIHKALADDKYITLSERRFVLIKESPGKPTIHHVSNGTTVLSHVGAGPKWSEIPSIYFGLNIIDVLIQEERSDKDSFFHTFKHLLKIEERAIENGYSHIEVYSPDVSRALNDLIDEIIDKLLIDKVEYEIVTEILPRRFTNRKRDELFRLLDARQKNDELNFDYDKNIKAVETLQRLARRYKKTGDVDSLEEVINILVAASGHDIHEIRNRANIILEKIFAPKEFDAPLAVNFINLRVGQKYKFTFALPVNNTGYFLRIYRNNINNRYSIEPELIFYDINLEYDDKDKVYKAEAEFDEYGHYDYVVCRKKRINWEWLDLKDTSGRINVIPALNGEIILEIFPDIHGHTGTYWNDLRGHQGLVYNENGEVIRLGRFSDITFHLEDLKKRLSISAVYLLGVQKRGSNREDWAPEATSPSPFSPMSLVEIEESIGGEKELKELIQKAHSLDIKIIIDIIPHLNRKSRELPDECDVKCYDEREKLVIRASTDGRYGDWNDGKLLNYRIFKVWEWLADSISLLMEKYDVDGIRFDSAHAAPIIMKKNNYPYIYNEKRTHKEMVEGTIIVNDREDDHFITTGYYDCACRDIMGVPLHYYLMQRIEKKLKETGKKIFINIAECYWGHEKFLARSGIIPYNSALFKICENIIQNKTDTREIYHLYDNYYPAVLPEGTELLGILGNHDERRALNTFGYRGLRAAVVLTIFMSNIIMDFEGNSEGESWKVYLDNIYVNWNQFEYASNRSLENFYSDWYRFFHNIKSGEGYLVWTNNKMTAAALRFHQDGIYIGAVNFADSNQNISLDFDNPSLPIVDEACYRLIDPLYSQITGLHGYYTGRELKISRINTVVSYIDRVKLLKLEKIQDLEKYYNHFLKDSFLRLCSLSDDDYFNHNFAFQEIVSRSDTFADLSEFLLTRLMPLMMEHNEEQLKLGMKRCFYHIYKNNYYTGEILYEYIEKIALHADPSLKAVGEYLKKNNRKGPVVFLSAEAVPFSKSGGLANVVYELPREMVKQGEEVYVITGLYRKGDEKSIKRMEDALEKNDASYTGKNVKFFILNHEYEVGVHSASVEGVTYFLLDHHEFFDGLYWGITSNEKLRRRIAFARASIETIIAFDLYPSFTVTNDAYTGLFNGLSRCDPYYVNYPNFSWNTFLHIIHNGGWQYFDSYHVYENGFNLFELFNLPGWKLGEFIDPYHSDRLNCMAAGIRFADRVITVSKSYAEQIQIACDGLESILHNVIGINNAIGNDFKEKTFRNIETSGFIDIYGKQLKDLIQSDMELAQKIDKRYPEILNGYNKIANPKRRYIVERAARKMMLQIQRGLRIDPECLMLCMIHRISEQKGFQLLLETSERIIKDLNCQIIAGGAVSSGDTKGEEIAHGLYIMSQNFPDSVSLNFGFLDISTPLFSSDVFCMPSMSEPGGISQLEAMACGCPIIARATGGLRDTVFPIVVAKNEITGNGFLFSDFRAWAFYETVKKAYDFFMEYDDDIIYHARINAENSVSYWDRPAKGYIKEIYNIKEAIRNW